MTLTLEMTMDPKMLDFNLWLEREIWFCILWTEFHSTYMIIPIIKFGMLSMAKLVIGKTWKMQIFGSKSSGNKYFKQSAQA